MLWRHPATEVRHPEWLLAGLLPVGQLNGFSEVLLCCSVQAKVLIQLELTTMPLIGVLSLAALSKVLSSLYYPSRERSFANTGTEWGLDIGIDAAAFMAKEFWPDIHHFLFRDGKPGDAAQH